MAYDRERPWVMKALIVGPVDTPYQNGCFEFDVLLPSNYPASPPKMKLVTTGNGSVRFNANLYANGKVCLSLLGTWRGPGWDPKRSTLLQVLQSIPWNIMIGEPVAGMCWFNEPGYDSGRTGHKTQVGKLYSEAYVSRALPAMAEFSQNNTAATTTTTITTTITTTTTATTTTNNNNTEATTTMLAEQCPELCWRFVCNDIGRYDKQIRRCTMVYAMEKIIRAPPSTFTSVIHSHFSTKFEAVTKQLAAWAQQEGVTAGV